MAGEPDQQLPVVIFDFHEGSTDLYINGSRKDFWLPTMFTHSELYKCNVSEPDVLSNMTKVQVQNELKPLSLETLRPRFVQNLSFFDYKQKLMDTFDNKDAITSGVYVEIQNNKIEQWTIVATGKKKRRKTTVPKQWSEIGLHCGENDVILLDVDPNEITFLPNSSVSQWLTFDEIQLYYPKEISPEQKARLKFRYRIKASSKSSGHKLYLEMILLPRQLDYENLPEIKKKIMESAGAKTIKFWCQSHPIFWEGANVTADVPLVPTFGVFESEITITDANLRRLIHDVNIQLEAGEYVHKLADMFKFMEGKSSTFIYHQKTLDLANPGDKEIVNLHEDEDINSSGKCVRINNKTIKVYSGTKYDRPVKMSAKYVKNLKSLLPRETTNDDILEMQHILSNSIANNTANNYNSVKKTLLSLCTGRNILQEPKFGDDALLLTRLSKIKTLKRETVRQYMKCYRTLVLMEGADPPPESPHFKQLKKGLANKGHNPMLYVAKSHRKAYSIPSLRVMSHAIASTSWSKFRKQAVFTTMLMAFWGRLRLSELLCSSGKNFKPNNAFLRNDCKYIESNEGKETLGIQLWIRHAKVPDPAGALVEIPPTEKFLDLCPIAALKKYLRMRNKMTSDGETPMILDDTGYIMTKHKFTTYIQEAIETLDPSYKDTFKDLKGHSLRSGVPTALQKLGSDVDPQVVQYLGRWRGCSVNLYLKDAAAASSARLAIANAVKKSLI